MASTTVWRHIAKAGLKNMFKEYVKNPKIFDQLSLSEMENGKGIHVELQHVELNLHALNLLLGQLPFHVKAARIGFISIDFELSFRNTKILIREIEVELQPGSRNPAAKKGGFSPKDGIDFIESSVRGTLEMMEASVKRNQGTELVENLTIALNTILESVQVTILDIRFRICHMSVITGEKVVLETTIPRLEYLSIVDEKGVHAYVEKEINVVDGITITMYTHDMNRRRETGKEAVLLRVAKDKGIYPRILLRVRRYASNITIPRLSLEFHIPMMSIGCSPTQLTYVNGLLAQMMKKGKVEAVEEVEVDVEVEEEEVNEAEVEMLKKTLGNLPNQRPFSSPTLPTSSKHNYQEIIVLLKVDQVCMSLFYHSHYPSLDDHRYRRQGEHLVVSLRKFMFRYIEYHQRTEYELVAQDISIEEVVREGEGEERRQSILSFDRGVEEGEPREVLRAVIVEQKKSCSGYDMDEVDAKVDIRSDMRIHIYPSMHYRLKGIRSSVAQMQAVFIQESEEERLDGVMGGVSRPAFSAESILGSVMDRGWNGSASGSPCRLVKAELMIGYIEVSLVTPGRDTQLQVALQKVSVESTMDYSNGEMQNHRVCVDMMECLGKIVSPGLGTARIIFEIHTRNMGGIQEQFMEYNHSPNVLMEMGLTFREEDMSISDSTHFMRFVDQAKVQVKVLVHFMRVDLTVEDVQYFQEVATYLLQWPEATKLLTSLSADMDAFFSNSLGRSFQLFDESLSPLHPVSVDFDPTVSPRPQSAGTREESVGVEMSVVCTWKHVEVVCRSEGNSFIQMEAKNGIGVVINRPQSQHYYLNEEKTPFTIDIYDARSHTDNYHVLSRGENRQRQPMAMLSVVVSDGEAKVTVTVRDMSLCYHPASTWMKLYEKVSERNGGARWTSEWVIRVALWMEEFGISLGRISEQLIGPHQVVYCEGAYSSNLKGYAYMLYVYFHDRQGSMDRLIAVAESFDSQLAERIRVTSGGVLPAESILPKLSFHGFNLRLRVMPKREIGCEMEVRVKQCHVHVVERFHCYIQGVEVWLYASGENKVQILTLNEVDISREGNVTRVNGKGRSVSKVEGVFRSDVLQGAIDFMNDLLTPLEGPSEKPIELTRVPTTVDHRLLCDALSLDYLSAVQPLEAPPIHPTSTGFHIIEEYEGKAQVTVGYPIPELRISEVPQDERIVLFAMEPTETIKQYSRAEVVEGYEREVPWYEKGAFGVLQGVKGRIIVDHVHVTVQFMGGKEWDEEDSDDKVVLGLRGVHMIVDKYGEGDIREHIVVGVKEIQLQSEMKGEEMIMLQRDPVTPTILDKDDLLVRLDQVASLEGIDDHLEGRLSFSCVPLFIQLNYDMVVFMVEYSKELKGDHPLIVPPPPMYFQSLSVDPIHLRVASQVQSGVDYQEMVKGDYMQLLRAIPVSIDAITIPYTRVSGLDGLGHGLLLVHQQLAPLLYNHIAYQVVTGIGPIRSLLSVVGSVQSVVHEPWKRYRKDGRVVEGLKDGVVDMAITCGAELISVLSKVAYSTQFAIEMVDAQLDPLEGTGREPTALLDRIHTAKRRIIAIPMKEVERFGKVGYITTALKAFPIAVITPLNGMAGQLGTSFAKLSREMGAQLEAQKRKRIQ